MDIGWFYRIILLIVLLILSAIFSGSEVALFSLDEKKLSELGGKSNLINRYISQLVKFPKRLLITILIGNTICNVAASIISVALSLEIAELYSYSIDLVLIIQIILLTVIVILFAEITPKVWANKYPLAFSKLIAIPLYWSDLLLRPISNSLSKLIKFATSRINYDKSKTALSTAEITELADIGVEKGTIEEEEHGLITGLVSFKQITVKEVMTPRVDMISVSTITSFEELIKIIRESGHSRLPVYSDDLDSIVGVIYAKDLLPYLSNKSDQNKFSVKKIIRECFFVPETKLISGLMQEFQQKNMHISIVVDEYGGTAGLVTLEDILEEIVGEIRDEYDVEEDEITKVEENKYVMNGSVSIDEVDEKLNLKIEVPDDDFETLGGYIFNHAGTIPEIGYSFEEYGCKFKVLELENNRINKVEIEKLS